MNLRFCATAYINTVTTRIDVDFPRMSKTEWVRELTWYTFHVQQLLLDVADVFDPDNEQWLGDYEQIVTHWSEQAARFDPRAAETRHCRAARRAAQSHASDFDR